jgi:hypothetical protein
MYDQQARGTTFSPVSERWVPEEAIINVESLISSLFLKSLAQQALILLERHKQLILVELEGKLY